MNITLEILSNGNLRFRRGNKAHNDNMLKILSHIIDDVDKLEELKEFFIGSEDIEVLVGDTIFCG